MQEHDQALNSYLLKMRKDSGLSVDKVCELTKIQSRFVLALEEGRYGELPSNTHLRAFSLAMTQAYGGDAEHTALLVRRVLTAVAAPGAVAVPSAKELAVRPLPPVPLSQAPSAQAGANAKAAPLASVAVAPSSPRVSEVAVEAAEAAEGFVAGASQRLKGLPWQALSILVGGAIVLSWAVTVGIDHWQHRADYSAAVQATPIESSVPLNSTTEKNGPGSATALSQAAETPALPSTPLVLRARRSCWLVLQIDGQRLPTITMQEGDKLTWAVKQKAVLLAGNIGALRVWWRGDNLAYLGELGSRANGLLFEPGKAVRVDKSSNLTLPAGVPE